MTRHIDIHVLQSVPPSNLNRDDTGSPKTAVYGGVRRARVSSQAWKHATRRAFSAEFDMDNLGFRTVRVVEMLASAIGELDASLPETERVTLAEAALKALGIKLKTPRKRKATDDETGPDKALSTSEYLLFLSSRQIENLAQVAIDARGGTIVKADAKRAATLDHGPDVGLFGRMVADDAALNVDAAVQVAHAISTHAVSNEFDYYTAVDDKNPRDDTGAGMIGTVEFNSATLYRYASINVDGLRDNLGDNQATTRAVGAFFAGFVRSMPTGKQNTFANRTLPSLVAVRVRDDQALSFVGAFESPVTPGSDGWLRGSVESLAAYSASLDRAYGTDGLTESGVMALGELESLAAPLGTPMSMEELSQLVSRAASVEA